MIATSTRKLIHEIGVRAKNLKFTRPGTVSPNALEAARSAAIRAAEQRQAIARWAAAEAARAAEQRSAIARGVQTFPLIKGFPKP